MPLKKKTKKVLRVGREEASSLSSFVERPVPSPSEVQSFERVIGRELREQEIDSNLDEIYSDARGARINVKKMKVKKRPMFLIRFFRYLLVLIFLALLAYGAYFYLFSNSNDISNLDFSISSPSQIIAGQTFSYQVYYHNPTRYPFTKLHLELQYPSNFIFSSASLKPSTGNSAWNLPNLAPGANVTLTITGKLIALPNSANVIFGHLSYLPSSFSSQFKKDASASTVVSGPGFNVDLDSSGTAFLGQNNDMTLIFSAIKNNYLGDFNITFSLPPHAQAAVVLNKMKTASSSAEKSIGLASSSPQISVKLDAGTRTWLVSGLLAPLERQIIPLTYQINEDSQQLATIVVRLSKKLKNGNSYIFWSKTIKPQLIKSDLNLTLKLNGSQNDGAVNFGQALNYSLSFSNKGNNSYKNVVIMAAVKGDFLNWHSVVASDQGQINNNTVIWTKSEVPKLALIKSGDSGSFNFKVNLLPFSIDDLGKSMSIVAYSQYSMNGQAISGDHNKSNTITSQINSNLALNEQIRYFNINNLPVGSGPLPPVVGQTTSFQVYWTVKNSLHSLTDTRVVLALPSYVAWNNNVSTDVGSLYYDNATHQVIWAIGRLPVSVGQVKASFSISITPKVTDRNKILVLSPGTTISAMDNITTAMINEKIKPKTTRLEDDNIAALNNSGIVQ